MCRVYSDCDLDGFTYGTGSYCSPDCCRDLHESLTFVITFHGMNSGPLVGNELASAVVTNISAVRVLDGLGNTHLKMKKLIESALS